MAAKRKPPAQVLGPHPPEPHAFANTLVAKDSETAEKIAHRLLREREGKRDAMVAYLRQILTKHHVSEEALARSQRRREALKRLGFEKQEARLRRFPVNDATRKGNLAEVVLAEYVVATSGAEVPIYRLRYNPNVDQSMKGDDVLAFDLEGEPVRIIVGESKFRGTSSQDAVREIADGLLRSHKAGVPVSLQFVADRLYEEGRPEVAERIEKCAEQIALGKLRLDYVGLLFSDEKAAARVHEATPKVFRQLAMISLGVKEPDLIVAKCYEGLD